MKSIFRFEGNPKNIPLSFSIGGKIIKGIPDSFSPKVSLDFHSSKIHKATIEGQNQNGLNIKVIYKEYMDHPVVEWVAYIKNNGHSSTPIISDLKLETEIACEDPVLYHGNGDTVNESGYEFFKDSVDKEIVLTPNDGTSCNGAFPYMRLLTKDFGVNIAIGWPAKWEAKFTPSDIGVKLTAKQERTNFIIYPGETMRTPTLTLQNYIGDEDFGANAWRHWYFDHILPVEKDGTKVSSKLCLHTWHIDGKEEFCGCTEENQIKAINTYIEKGIKPDVWWIDAGWYPCSDHWVIVGDWSVRKDNFPNGLKPVADLCDKNDISLLLWFEPERIYTGTKLDIEHPEWILKLYDENGNRVDYSLLDMSNDDATEYIIETFDKIVKDNGVKIYREDYNINPLPFWMKHETKDRIGAMENRHVQNHLKLWDTLIFRNPGLFIDSCASGGRRNDLEMMKRAVPLHYTDIGYGNHLIKQKQHREMFEWIPYFRAHTYSWDTPEKNYQDWYQRPLVDEFAFLNAYAPAMTCMIEYYHDEEQFNIGKKEIPVWREAADMMLSLDYYPLTECNKNPEEFYAMQFNEKDGEYGFALCIRNIMEQSGEYILKLKHIDANADYDLSYPLEGRNEIVSGKELTNGYVININERSGKVIFYRKEK